MYSEIFFIFLISASRTVEKFTFELEGDYLKIKVIDKFIEKKDVEVNNYLYYHIQNPEGYLDKYWLIDVYQSDAAKINISDLEKGNICRRSSLGVGNTLIIRKENQFQG